MIYLFTPVLGAGKNLFNSIPVDKGLAQPQMASSSQVSVLEMKEVG